MSIIHGKLPTRLLKVNVPVVATYTDEEIELFGLPLNTVDGSLKKFDTSEMTTVHLSLDRIIDIYSNGFTISLVNQDEVSFVYDALEDYLKANTSPVISSPNAPNQQDDRLEQIEIFADEIFNLNRHNIVKTNIRNISGGFDLGINTMSFSPVSTGRRGPVKKVGVLDGYDDPEEEVGTENAFTNATYINTSIPDVDPRRVKRKTIYVNEKDMI